MKTLFTTVLALIVLAGTAQRRDTSLINEAKRQAEFDKKVADTANYWLKDISDPVSLTLTERLLPKRDTVQCHIEIILAYEFEPVGDMMSQSKRVAFTQWVLGYVTRRKEHITGFFYDENAKWAIKQSILNYKLLKQ